MKIVRALERLVGAPKAPITEADLSAAVGDPALAARMAVRISPRARRVSLRVDVTSNQVILIQPRRMSARAALAFVAARRDWIADHLAKMPARIVFADGVSIPLRGATHIVRYAPETRGGVWRRDGEIVVAGRVEHAPRRLTDWLKDEARAAIAPLARSLAEKLDRKVTRVSVRDTTSRWGSCSRGGALSFSWRLILAPDAVFTYVVAHEVAHLRHMNHGPAFWRTVEMLMPDGAEAARSAREWLRVHGAVLHGYG